MCWKGEHARFVDAWILLGVYSLESSRDQQALLDSASGTRFSSTPRPKKQYVCKYINMHIGMIYVYRYICI